MNYLWVFIGGGLGSMLRFGIADYLSRYEFVFPWATLVANFAASLLLGFFLGQALMGPVSDVKKALLMTGFCGGFSTFSTFSAESFLLLQEGQYGYAIMNIGCSILTCLGGVYLGLKMGSQ